MPSDSDARTSVESMAHGQTVMQEASTRPPKRYEFYLEAMEVRRFPPWDDADLDAPGMAPLKQAVNTVWDEMSHSEDEWTESDNESPDSNDGSTDIDDESTENPEESSDDEDSDLWNGDHSRDVGHTQGKPDLKLGGNLSDSDAEHIVTAAMRSSLRFLRVRTDSPTLKLFDIVMKAPPGTGQRLTELHIDAPFRGEHVATLIEFLKRPDLRGLTELEINEIDGYEPDDPDWYLFKPENAYDFSRSEEESIRKAMISSVVHNLSVQQDVHVLRHFRWSTDLVHLAAFRALRVARLVFRANRAPALPNQNANSEAHILRLPKEVLGRIVWHAAQDDKRTTIIHPLTQPQVVKLINHAAHPLHLQTLCKGIADYVLYRMNHTLDYATPLPDYDDLVDEEKKWRRDYVEEWLNTGGFFWDRSCPIMYDYAGGLTPTEKAQYDHYLGLHYLEQEKYEGPRPWERD